HAALDRCAIRLAAPRLAPGSFRVCRLHNHSVVLDPACCAEYAMIIDAEIAPKRRKRADRGNKADHENRRPSVPPPSVPVRRRFQIIPFLITLVTVALAVAFGWAAWDTYMGMPWTRDGTVRAYVVTMAPEVAGRIVELPVVDNQFVHKGDLLMVIDPINYRIAVSLAEATVKQTQANAQNAKAQAERRRQLTTLSTSMEEKQTFAANELATNAQTEQAQANLDQARVNLERTQIKSPVNGYVTNLMVQLGDFAEVGKTSISIVDADSFWLDGYFEETYLDRIREGDSASIRLMGYSQIVRGHVDSIARAINVANAQANEQGLATVNPIFTWVRLAQRIPIRIHID